MAEAEAAWREAGLSELKPPPGAEPPPGTEPPAGERGEDRARSRWLARLAAMAGLSGQASWHFADVALPVSLGLWARGVIQTNVSSLGSYGLLAVAPVVFYAGLALLVVSIGCELARTPLSRWRLALHAVALVVMLYGTAPLVYPDGRYAWLYKTIGVVQYVSAHGQLSAHVDIYQNWPGFFALMAWFGKVAGVASPLAYAKWSQLVIELAALPLLYLVYGALFLPARQRWVAMLLYSASNWIGQDYFSPQALGTLLSLGLVAIILRWLHSGNAAGNRSAQTVTVLSRAENAAGWEPPPEAGSQVPYLVAALAIFFVVTFTHELSPYLLIIQIGALAIVRLVRPRWLPLAFAAIAIGYLVPRFQYVQSHYGLLQSIGNFFGNAAPPSLQGGPVPLSQRLIQYSADLLSLGIWCLALAGGWRRRRSRRTVLTLVALAFSPFWVLGFQAYGNEGVLRVYLFSLPWATALAAAVLAPTPVLGSRRTGTHQLSRSGLAAFVLGMRPGRGIVRVPVALGVATALFLPAFFGDDGFNVMPAGQVSLITTFLAKAPSGPIYSPVVNAPLADTARYPDFPTYPIFGPFGLLGRARVTPAIANVIAADSRLDTGGQGPAYVIITTGELAYIQAYGVVSRRSLDTLLSALARSTSWKLVIDHAGTVIYELPPRVPVQIFQPPG